MSSSTHPHPNEVIPPSIRVVSKMCVEIQQIYDYICSSNPTDVARNLLLRDRDNECRQQGQQSEEPQHQEQHEKQTCGTLTKRKTYAARTSSASSLSSTTTGAINAEDRSMPDRSNGDSINGVLRKAIAKLQRKLQEPTKKKFYLHTRLDTHILPLTNVAFDRSGERCLTGSYDRTCAIVNTHDGNVEHVLREHDNVVFSVAFNFPKW